MGLKKTWFSYINALLGLCGIGYLLFNLLFSMKDMWEHIDGSFSFAITENELKIIVISLIFVTFIFLTVGINIIKNHISLPDVSESIFVRVLAMFIFVLFIAFFVYSKYNDIFAYDADFVFDEDKMNMIINAFNGDGFRLNNLSDLYYFLAGFLIRIFGEKTIVIAIYNAVLDLLILFLIFGGISKLIGFIPGVFSLIAPFFLINEYFDIYDINPIKVYLLIVSFVIFLVFNIFSIIGNEGELEEANYRKTGFLVSAVICTLLIFAITYSLIYFLEESFSLNIDTFDVNEVLNIFNNIYIYLGFLISCLYFYISSFFEKEDETSIITIPFIFSALLVSLNIYSGFNVYVFIVLFSALSGLGIRSLLFKSFKPVSYNFDNELIDNMMNNKISEVYKTNDETTEENANDDDVDEANDSILVSENTEVIVIDETVSNSDISESCDKSEVLFIENPLPLPKAHVKKTMDYSFWPDEEHMKYDVEINDSDDFDII